MNDQYESIKKNAGLVIKQFAPLSGIEFGLNRDSVEWVEGFIERQRAREDFDLNKSARLIDVLGSFGECIIANTGGEWLASETYGLGVTFPDGSVCYPFNKMGKMFRDGLAGGDTILSFYDTTVNFIAKGRFREEGSSD